MKDDNNAPRRRAHAKEASEVIAGYWDWDHVNLLSGWHREEAESTRRTNPDSPSRARA